MDALLYITFISKSKSLFSCLVQILLRTIVQSPIINKIVFKAIPHNSKCRYGERGTADAKTKAQIILDAAKVSAASGGNSEPKQGQRSQSARGFCPEARCGYRNPTLSSILATQMPCRTPSRSEALRSATAACGGSWRGDPPERCLSRKAGIMRCCLIAIEHARNDKGLTMEDLAERIRKSKRYVVAIERGERTPSLKTCYQIVRCLGISTDKLFYPEATLDENSATREITRMAATCTSKQLWFY